MLEDFHSLGRLATVALIDLAQISASDRVLDAGTGIGGTARLIAADRGAHVTAVDLTPEYCEVATWLNDEVGLGDMIEVRTADVTELPFEAGSFDVVISQHVQMNIADKRTALRRGASRPRARRSPRAVGRDRRLRWAAAPAGRRGPTSPEQSHLVTPERLAELLRDAGFATAHWNDLTEAGRAGHARSSSPASDRSSGSTCSSRTFRPRRPTSYATSRRPGPPDPGGPHGAVGTILPPAGAPAAPTTIMWTSGPNVPGRLSTAITGRGGDELHGGSPQRSAASTKQRSNAEQEACGIRSRGRCWC